MCSIVQALTLTIAMASLFNSLFKISNNRFFKLTVWALRTDFSEFQG